MPKLSFVISTFNRRDVLLGTLARLRDCEVEHEIFVIDNASADGTADAVRTKFPHVHLIALNENRGSCAKNLALPECAGNYVVFLDDDSYPQRGSIQRMVEHFQALPKLGAAGFTVTLPDASRECSAYPDVFIGCGVGFRREALRQVGGLPNDFFMQAEEYDLSLRLLDAGWDIRTFDDLHVAHLKTPGARISRRTMRLDVRNNLVLVARHFPEAWAAIYWREWARRYWAIASSKGQRLAFLAGAAEAVVRMIRDVGRRPVSEKTFERFARIEETRQRLRAAGKNLSSRDVPGAEFPEQCLAAIKSFPLARSGYPYRRVLFADYGKNIFAYWRAAQACGMEIVAIADGNLAKLKIRYRGIPIIEDELAAQLDFDAVIVSNLSPVHAALAAERWRRRTDRPVVDLFQ